MRTRVGLVAIVGCKGWFHRGTAEGMADQDWRGSAEPLLDECIEVGDVLTNLHRALLDGRT